MNELVQPVTTLFTEASLTTRPSARHANRPSKVSLWYNTEFWEVGVDDEKHHCYHVSPFGVFRLNQLRQYLVIYFDWSRYPKRYPNGIIPVKQQFVRWCQGGKYERVVALFHTIRTPSGKLSDRVLAVAALDAMTYNAIKHAMVEAYLDWSMTGTLPFITPDNLL